MNLELHPQKRLKIGVFDSGFGGLTVLKSLLTQIPYADYVYLGDSARTPYGTKGRETIVSYSFECADFLLSYGIDVLVVACNTASAAALNELTSKLPIPVFGTVEPACADAVRLLEESCSSSSRTSDLIAVIGTEGTVRSGAYDACIQRIRPGTTVVSQPCPLFVPIIEQGIFSGPIVDEVLDLYLSEIRSVQPHSIILGCTHYPLFHAAIQTFVGDQTVLIDSSQSIADHLATKYAAVSYTDDSRNPSVLFFTTDNSERFNRVGTSILAPLIAVNAEQIHL